MDIETYNMGAYKLHFIKSKKFKTISIDINFYNNFVKEDITKRNLLKMILIDSNKNYPTEKDLIIESENLYDIKISSKISRVGNFSNLSFQTSFLNEKFTESDMNKESIIFFLSLIFNPNVENNCFINIEKQKDRLYQNIVSLKDNKIKYSMLCLLEKIKDRIYSYNTFGYIEDLEDIDGKELYNYYKRVLNEDQIDIFVLGDFSSNEMKEIFKEYFKISTFKKENKNLIVEELIPRKRVNKYVIYDKVKQSQLVALCSLNNLTDFERKYTIKVYNELLGGSSNSVLFNTIREKNNYCYFINSNIKAYDNILLINSGIEKKNINVVYKLIRKCLKDITDGKIDNDMLEATKKTIISSIMASSDTSIGTINAAFSKIFVNGDDNNTRIANFKKITKDDIVKVGKKVNLHSILTLEGESKYEEN